MFDAVKQLFAGKTDTTRLYGKRLVLIVDDNPTDRLLFQRTVEKMGHRVLTAVNGREGLEMARRHKPDLILSDCRMPEMDGLAMCRFLKDDPATKGIPLIYLTSHDSPTVVVQYFDLEVENLLCKPINPKLLRGQIETVFQEHFAESDPPSK